MSLPAGEALLDLCRHAQSEIFLAAPFIKQSALKRILSVIPSCITKLTIVTRWTPEEIAAGVSDLEVFDLVCKLPNTQLLLLPGLHAKYYRADDSCLVGSANITDKALGWFSFSNIELLIDQDPNDPRIQTLEAIIQEKSVVASKAIYDALKVQVEHLLQDKQKLQEIITNNNYSCWLPTCIRPDYLYRIYSQRNLEELLESVVASGKSDLIGLGTFSGMDEAEFKRYVVAILEQSPISQEIFQMSQTAGITSDQAINLISKYRDRLKKPYYDAEMYWRIFKDWQLYFFPDRYRVRSAGEVFEQARIIP